MKNIIRIVFTVVCLAGCNQAQRDESPDEKTKVTELKSSTPEEINGMSIYQLPSIWKTQSGDEITFKDLEGDVLVVVMIYTSCQSACPRLVADMKGIESKVSERVSKGVRYVLVSIDPEHDTPERLEQFSIENEMTDSQWLFLQGTKETVREFANIVAVRYKSISPMEFSHSNIISVFDREGVMQHQQEGLAVDYEDTVNAVLELARQPGPIFDDSSSNNKFIPTDNWSTCVIPMKSQNRLTSNERPQSFFAKVRRARQAGRNLGQ